RVPGARARCRCGARGCLETVASIDAVYARLDRGAAPDLAGAAARSVLAEAGHALGVVLAGLCNCLNPQAVVIGGELGAAGAAGDAVIAAVRTAIDTEAMPAVARAVTVLRAQLGARAELLGAVWWAIEQAQRAA
ncbi:MAG: ROK family protein, partial [Jatrophihabitans sp.]|uniref:ROK family protein n=1 Tax=Jatrophihabitans sp. TaxID=1932789 RepID=UPI003F7F2D30